MAPTRRPLRKRPPPSSHPYELRSRGRINDPNNLVSAMQGDEGKNPTPTTIDGLAAMMTKILGRLDALTSSTNDIKARLTALVSQRAPISAAPFSYGMPGYGSTSLGSPSFTAAATMATAAFPSFTAPSPVPGSAADVRLPKARASPSAIVPSFTKDLCADIRVTIVQIQAAL